MMNSLFSNMRSLSNINFILQYSYIILIFVSLALLVIANRKTKVKRIRINKKKTKKKALKDYKILKTPLGKIAYGISFTNSFSRELNNAIALVIIIIYGFATVMIYNYISHFSFLWYTKFVNLIVALFLPYALIHTYIGIQINIIAKQIPSAFSEILSAYRSDKRIKAAIEEAVQYMDKNIKREYQRIIPYLGSETTFEYGLDYFSTRMNNTYITLFTTLVKESRYKNSDITEALEKLAIKTRSKNYMKEKAKRQLVWYRVFLIIWLFSIPAVMKFVSSASLEAYRYYNTVEGGMLLTVTMLSVVGGYIAIMIMERS